METLHKRAPNLTAENQTFTVLDFLFWWVYLNASNKGKKNSSHAEINKDVLIFITKTVQISDKMYLQGAHKQQISIYTKWRSKVFTTLVAHRTTLWLDQHDKVIRVIRWRPWWGYKLKRASQATTLFYKIQVLLFWPLQTFSSPPCTICICKLCKINHSVILWCQS